MLCDHKNYIILNFIAHILISITQSFQFLFYHFYDSHVWYNYSSLHNGWRLLSQLWSRNEQFMLNFLFIVWLYSGLSFLFLLKNNIHNFFFVSSRTETIPGNPSYKATMRLHITNVQQSDYGSYKCVAKNPRGEMDGTIKLYSK